MRARWLLACGLMAAWLAVRGGPPGAHAAELDCVIEPHMIVAVSFPVEGLLETVAVDRGDLVKAGQVLATLESSVEKATVALARFRTQLESPLQSSEIRLAFGERKVGWNEELFQEGGISAREVDEARTSRDLARAGVVEAQENRRLAQLELDRAVAALAIRTIRSPVAGVVMERLQHPGEIAKQGPILKLAQLDPLRVEVIVPVALLGKISVGMVAQVMPENPVGGTYAAKVTVVDRVADAASGTFGVRLELPNPDYRLPAGLKCKVRFPRE
ncbi:MAG: efflux RND transporter periplasmic adaptor subunit [Armatimonadota bacterium]|nr:efflux RND transporter periplasmic adaptor subunit [Armatimonadota bacterium]